MRFPFRQTWNRERSTATTPRSAARHSTTGSRQPSNSTDVTSRPGCSVARVNGITTEEMHDVWFSYPEAQYESAVRGSQCGSTDGRLLYRGVRAGPERHDPLCLLPSRGSAAEQGGEVVGG